MHPNDFLESLVSRTVSYRFHGHDLRFDLSTALFSSAGVDSGTQMLLRCVSEVADRDGLAGVTDVGCGTGALGIPVSSLLGLPLHASDRDALACWFTERNSRANGVKVQTNTALGAPAVFPGAAMPGSSLKLCNIPAKAGAPVLELLISDLLRNDGGTALVGLVIVEPLADTLTKMIGTYGGSVLVRRSNRNHLAVVVTPGAAPDMQSTYSSGPQSDLPHQYIRGTAHFQAPAGQYQLDTAYNLPEFDSLGYDTELLFELFRKSTPGGAVFCWGPGQGHVPAAVALGSKNARLWIADRDALAVAMTRHNLSAMVPACDVSTLVSPSLSYSALEVEPGSVDWMVVRSAPEPGSQWAKEIGWSASTLLRPGGRLAIGGKSGSLARLMTTLRDGFSQVLSVRSRGHRADVLQRKR